MKYFCPLCKSYEIAFCEKIRTKDIIKLYRKEFNCNISYLFNAKKIYYVKCKICDLNFFLPIIIGDEAFYNILQKYDWYYKEHKEEFLFARNFIKPYDRVLEIGCGRGVFSKIISSKDYKGLDFSLKAQEIAKNTGTIIEDIPIQDYSKDNKNKYDIVCCFQVIEHVADIYGFLKAAIECLKKDGLLIAAVPYVDSFMKYMPNRILNMPPHHVSHWSDNALKYIGTLFGLDIVDLHHEKCALSNRKWAEQLFSAYSFRKKIGFKTKIINVSFIDKVYLILGNIWTQLLKEYPGEKEYFYGHSTTIVFKKRF